MPAHAFAPAPAAPPPCAPVLATPADASDAELVSTYLATNADAPFAEIVRRYQVRVYRVLLGLLGSDALADEITQRTFVKAAFRLEQLRDPNALYGWLLRIARTTALDELKRPERTRRCDADGAADELAYFEPKHEVRRLVRRVLGMLSFEDREILLLVDLEQHTTRELTSVLGISQSAVKMRAMRARQRFRHLYEELSSCGPATVSSASC